MIIGLYENAMDYTFRIVDKEDIEQLTILRVKVLIAANELSRDTDMSLVEKETRKYYEEFLGKEEHFAVVAYDNGKPIGTGAISFYKVMPTYHNVTGEKAYIMNMYTEPEYRRRGIATRILKMLIEEARKRNIVEVTLEATKMGKPLYEKNGFSIMESEMELK